MKTKIIALLATGLLLMSLVGPAFAAQHKAYMCHSTGDSTWTLVYVSENSAHMNDSNPHGDMYVGDSLPFTFVDCDTLAG